MNKGKLLMGVGVLLIFVGFVRPFGLLMVDQTGATFFLTVQRPDGTPIPGAIVTLVSVSWMQQGVPAISVPWNADFVMDAQGKNNFYCSMDGIYYFKASAPGFDTVEDRWTGTGGVVKSITFVLEGGAPPPPPPEPPEGYWDIGTRTHVGKDDIVYIPTEQLPIKYVCTSGASRVQSVVVKVYDVDGVLLNRVELTKQSTSVWATVFDLPEGQGVYTVEGHVTSDTGTFRELSLFGDGESSMARPPNMLYMSGGFGLFVIGLFLYRRED